MQGLALLGFGVAFSPLLVDLVWHWVQHPWARYSLLFAPLLFVAARSDTHSAAPAREGWLLIGAALTFELLAVGAGYTRLARPALPLGFLGLCRVFGWVSWPVGLLAFWLVPVPHAALGLASPLLEVSWLRLGALLPSAFGVPVLLQNASLVLPDAVLSLERWDSGLLLALLLSGLGWYQGLRAGAPPLACGLRAVGFGAVGFAVQAVAVVGWVALRAAGAAHPGSEWLTPGLVLLCFAGLLVAIEGRAAARGARVEEFSL